jgi:hypothetical protein
MKRFFLNSIPLVLLCSFVGYNNKVYDALASDSESLINIAIETLEGKNDFLSKGYKGALYMKSAQFEFTPWSKLKRFKEGRIILDNQISIHKDNPELRFIRLMIQENCPSLLGYSDSVEVDAKIVLAGYEQMSDLLKKRIREYANISKKLNSNDFK